MNRSSARPGYGLIILLVLGGCGGSPNSDRDAPPGQASTTVTAVPRLDPQSVPADLRHLIPLARQWGIGDDVERLAKVDAATPAQRAELRNGLAPHQARITAWLDSFGDGQMSEEAATFMYMQLAVEEMVGKP